MVAKTTTQVAQQISYRFNNGVPNQLSQRVGPTRVSNRIRYDGFYVQDQWTRRRLTLQGALRFETASSWAPDGENGIIDEHQFGPAFIFPRTDGVDGLPRHLRRAWASPTTCSATARRRVKVNFGKYLQGAYTGRRLHDQQPGVDARARPSPRSGPTRTTTGSPSATS